MAGARVPAAAARPGRPRRGPVPGRGRGRAARTRRRRLPGARPAPPPHPLLPPRAATSREAAGPSMHRARAAHRGETAGKFQNGEDKARRVSGRNRQPRGARGLPRPALAATAAAAVPRAGRFCPPRWPSWRDVTFPDSEMAQGAVDLLSGCQRWTRKLAQWEQASASESRQDICLHLPEFQDFLRQLYETLKAMDSKTILENFPTVGELLAKTCRNPFILAYDESQKVLIWCLCSLMTEDPRRCAESRLNSWTRGLLSQVLSAFRSELQEVGLFTQRLGYAPTDCYPGLLKNVVSSLVRELRENHCNGFNTQGRLAPDRVKSLSQVCVPLVTLPDLEPLVTALLTCPGCEPQEVLCPEFLTAVNAALMQKKVSLPTPAVVCLWLRHLPSLEAAVLRLLETVTARERRSVRSIEDSVRESLLPEAACHPAVFRVVDETFRSALLETDGAPEILATLQVFTRCFVDALGQASTQLRFPLQAYFPYAPTPLLTVLRQDPKDTPRAQWQQLLEQISDLLRGAVEQTRGTCRAAFDGWFLLMHFGAWAGLAAEQLVRAGAEPPEALLWLLAFGDRPEDTCQQREQTMAEVAALCRRLRKLRRAATPSAWELLAAAGPGGHGRLPRQLLLLFLLWTPGGHSAALDVVTLLAPTAALARDTTLLLEQTLCTWDRLCAGASAPQDLARALLRELSGQAGREGGHPATDTPNLTGASGDLKLDPGSTYPKSPHGTCKGDAFGVP